MQSEFISKDYITDSVKIDKEERLKILKQMNRYLRTRIFAHHPDCDQYDHHIIKIKSWSVCLGDFAMYSAIVILLMGNLAGFGGYWNFKRLNSFFVGMLFFTPAIMQLFWKSRKKGVKFLMRFSLGISIYFLIRFCFQFSQLYLKMIHLAIFVIVTIIYGLRNGRTHLNECVNCIYGENYSTCLQRHLPLLSIDGIEKVQDISPAISRIINLKNQRSTNN